MALEEYILKKVVLFYDDGREIKRKQGTVKKISDGLLLILENGNPEDEIMIPIARIIRVEVVE